MILADTSIWIDHFRKADDRLRTLLINGEIVCHPFVIGELAMGSLKQRDNILGWLKNLPQMNVAFEDEILIFIKSRSLFGLGLGYIDAHLLASVQMTPGALLWTRDKRLHNAATKISSAYPEAISN